jgi:hypothetical protein
METFHSPDATLVDYNGEPRKHHAQGCLVTDIQSNPYYQFAMHEEYNDIKCGIKNKGMKMYYNRVLKEGNHVQRFPNCKNRVCIQKLVVSLPGD